MTLTVRQRCEADGFYLRELCQREGKALCEIPCYHWGEVVNRLPLVTRQQWITTGLTVMASLATAALLGIFAVMWQHNLAFTTMQNDVVILKENAEVERRDRLETNTRLGRLEQLLMSRYQVALREAWEYRGE